MRYLPNSMRDREEMLGTLGYSSIEDLFSQIPEQIRLRGRLDLPGPLSEQEVLEFFKQAASHSTREYASLLGAGAYSHFRPAAVDALLSRGEFFTAYTPYQAELAQGTLQAMFEFQTLIAQLTGMEVSNASLYDGSTATTEAVLMALRLTRRNRVVASRTLHPEYREVMATYLRHLGTEAVEIPYSASGQIDLAALEAALSKETAAVVVQSPNFLGVIERFTEIAEVVHRSGALMVVTINEPLSLAVVNPPAEADIICGEAQSFGVPVAFGGPYVGFLATREKFVRQMPGRLVGQTTDTQGRRGFVLTLATREQHIRREKATSNICTNQSLCALAATIYLCLLGKQGLRALAEHNLAKAHYAASQLATVPGASIPFAAPFFNEFVVKAPGNAEVLLQDLRQENILGGVNLERFYPELSDHLLVCVTETVNKSALDRMVRTYQKFSGQKQARAAAPSGVSHPVGQEKA
ncbi:MAG: aminomethyl-transferring glycine dehydrogenase subunit GcvPA [Acidobacteria bacterium]|nr:MAG: aminomethyl-transferring glycine dehydrogenase subunit GcvPA [Acidobacteriota bacterium]